MTEIKHNIKWIEEAILKINWKLDLDNELRKQFKEIYYLWFYKWYDEWFWACSDIHSDR